jgi:hypothetical protein
MLDWLRYFPLTLRYSSEPVTPQGPYFPWMLKHKWQFRDSYFHLRCPIANPVMGDPGLWRKSLSPGRDDITQYSFNNGQLALMHTQQRWRHEHFFARTWLFVGPWFMGIKSFLAFSASIITAKKTEMFPESSFFHPRVFENAVVDYLNSYFGHVKTGQKPHFRGPLNWKILDISDTIKAALMDIHVIGNTSINNPCLKKMIFFSISDTQIINLYFDFGGTLISGRDPVNPAPMLELADKIIASFRLEVGPKTLADWNAVKAICPDMSITPEFGELKWPVNPKDIGKAQPLPQESKSSVKLIERDKEKQPKN